MPNVMQMSSNNELRSLTLGWAHEKFDVRTSPYMSKHGLNITADLYSEKAFVKIFPSSGNFFLLLDLLLIFAVSICFAVSVPFSL